NRQTIDMPSIGNPLIFRGTRRLGNLGFPSTRFPQVTALENSRTIYIHASENAMCNMSTEKPKRRPRYRGKSPRHFSEKYKEHAPERYADDVAKVIDAGKTPAGTHRAVMLRETIQVLAPQAGELAVDCTLGYGGHG